MRTPFPDHQISKLPKPTKQQTEEVKNNYRAGVRCSLCGGWHHPKVVHLDYVGHAAITDRMLEVDPSWTWEPLALSPDGYPVIDGNGGMWIKLTINGVTRLGYGDAPNKNGGDAMKERIGDAIRNAAMRFGAALDLWHKGELHRAEDPDDQGAAIGENKDQPMMPAAASPAPKAVDDGAPPVSSDDGDDPVAELGEVAFVTTKLKLLKETGQAAVLAEARLDGVLSWDASKSVLEGTLTKSGFASIKAALRGKK